MNPNTVLIQTEFKQKWFEEILSASIASMDAFQQLTEKLFFAVRCLGLCHFSIRTGVSTFYLITQITVPFSRKVLKFGNASVKTHCTTLTVLCVLSILRCCCFNNKWLNMIALFCLHPRLMNKFGQCLLTEPFKNKFLLLYFKLTSVNFHFFMS